MDNRHPAERQPAMALLREPHRKALRLGTEPLLATDSPHKARPKGTVLPPALPLRKVDHRQVTDSLRRVVLPRGTVLHQELLRVHRRARGKRLVRPVALLPELLRTQVLPKVVRLPDHGRHQAATPRQQLHLPELQHVTPQPRATQTIRARPRHNY